MEGWIRDEGLPHTVDRGRLLVRPCPGGAMGGEPRPRVTGRVPCTGKIGVRHRECGSRRCFARAASGATCRQRMCPKCSSMSRQRCRARRRPFAICVAQRLRAPGGVTIAPVGGGFALPHPSARIALGRDSGTVALLLLREGLPLAEPPADGVPVTRLFFFIAPSPRAHLDVLGRLGRLLTRGPLRELVNSAAPDEEILQAVAAFDRAPVSGADAEPAS